MDLKNYKRVGVAIAMTSESESLLASQPFKLIEKTPFEIYNFKDLYIVSCGYGTLNAALATQYLIAKYNCDCIVNFGVCGYTGKKNLHGVLFSVDKAYKRDVDCCLLGYEKYALPHDTAFISLKTDIVLPQCTLFTSDEFVGPDSKVESDVLVDMEGYAVAFACRRHGVDCYLFKSVCDSAEENTDRQQYDDKLDGALMGMDEYINKMFADYLDSSAKV